MNNLLNEIRHDAIQKLRLTSNNDIQPLLDAACHILSLYRSIRKEGLFYLEEALQHSHSEFIKHIFMMVANGYEPESIIEIATNEYWTMNPEGIQAMIAYFYIRSAIYIQSGESMEVLREIMYSLIPADKRQKYKEGIEEYELQYRKSISEKFACTATPVFQTENARKNIGMLEKELSGLPERSIQRLVREIESHSLAKCIYALPAEFRQKIITNLSERYANIIMETVVDGEHWYTPLDAVYENHLSDAVSDMLSVLNRLREQRAL